MIQKKDAIESGLKCNPLKHQPEMHPDVGRLLILIECDGERTGVESAEVGMEDIISRDTMRWRDELSQRSF